MVRRNSWSGKPTKTVSLLRLRPPGISYSHTSSYSTSRNLSKLPVKCSYCICLWVQCLLLQVNRSRLLNLRTYLSPQIWGCSLPCKFRSLMNPRKGVHFKFHSFEVCPAFVLGQEWWLSSSVHARTEPDISPACFSFPRSLKVFKRMTYCFMVQIFHIFYNFLLFAYLFCSLDYFFYWVLYLTFIVLIPAFYTYLSLSLFARCWLM